MNIKEAKEQIKNAMTAYFSKDDAGEYIIPTERQRPVFLMGPPGIGKTAIMEQIAAEMGVGLLTYSMTHHTRQSALGLPFIVHKKYKGIECDISEYTMSEIIASVYELMEQTNIEEGILFLDEINCVSETLAPVMLQFLQYKVFGRHRVPEGWIIVTAGNPPEYNNSVREFDIVTWDRLKRVDIEPDFNAWKEYAYAVNVHPAILTYLEIKKSDFYLIETGIDGKTFVTARGWDDLSKMIQLYEMKDLAVDEKLISQYIQNPRIAKDFAVYYDLYQKYKSDYQIDKVLSGKMPADIVQRASEAKFDERLSLIGMLLDSVGMDLRTAVVNYQILKELTAVLMNVKKKFLSPEKLPADYMKEMAEKRKEELENGRRSGSLSKEVQGQIKRLIHILESQTNMIHDMDSHDEAFKVIKSDYDNRVKQHNNDVRTAGKHLTNMFLFAEKAFGDGQEMLIIVTELTTNRMAANFISKYGCDEYFKHNKNLLIYDRQKEIEREIKQLKI